MLFIIGLFHKPICYLLKLAKRHQNRGRGEGGHEFTGTGALDPNSAGVTVPRMYVG